MTRILLEKQRRGINMTNEPLIALLALRANGWSFKVVSGEAWASKPAREKRCRAYLDPDDWERALEYAAAPSPDQAERLAGLIPKLVNQLKHYEAVIYGPDNC